MAKCFFRKPLFIMLLGAALLCPFITGCDDDDEIDLTRYDTAVQLDIAQEGSVQNPAWSPDSSELVVTVFREGYNEEPADIVVFTLGSGASRILVSDESANVNLPGSSWNPDTGMITFSSSRDPHDEIYMIDADGAPGSEEQITDRDQFMAYEPSFSPDGEWVVFESHLLDQEGDGVITTYAINGDGSYFPLTPADEDCRQPNWSPAGDRILYQRYSGGQWEIWVMDTDGSNKTQVTSGPGDKTDASFSPDGNHIVYSSDQGDLPNANIFVIPTGGGEAEQVTDWDGYDGAPSFSPDGTKIAFESYPGDPDDSDGTTIWVIDAP